MFEGLEKYLYEHLECSYNEDDTQKQLRHATNNYLRSNLGNIQEYFIVCDNSNNSGYDIDNNIINLKIEYTKNMVNYKYQDFVFKLPFNKTRYRKKKMVNLLS